MDKEKELYAIRPIAHIRSGFTQKFGIPRQPGLVPGLCAEICFTEAFSDPDAVRGLEAYSHLWLIWGFSESRSDMREEKPDWRPLVRPPRLGGKVRKGVFATRAPYRPNGLGLSVVALKEIRTDAGARVSLVVEGADLLDGTPIYDIKPYVPYSDIVAGAVGGFACGAQKSVAVEFPEELLAKVEPDVRETLRGLLQLDPRGTYEQAPGSVYGMQYGGYEVRFCAEGGTLRVVDVLTPEESKGGVDHVK